MHLAAWTGVAVVAVTAAGAGTLWARLNSEEPSRYSCKAPVVVTGTPLPGQAALVRCYVRALHDHDATLLSKIATDPAAQPLPVPPADANSARARFFDFDAGMGDQRVAITFADGQQVTLRIGEAPSDLDPAVWRLEPTP